MPLPGTVQQSCPSPLQTPATGLSARSLLVTILLLSICIYAFAPRLMAFPVQDPPGQNLPQGVIRSAEGAEPWPEELWPEDAAQPPQLPQTPASIADLKRDGNVKFVFYDPARYPRKFTGETKFTIQFESNSTFRWRQIREASGKRYLAIRTSFRKPDFKLQHQILLPTYLVNEKFFESELVKHEFDHVRISTDPRFRETFSQWLEKELKVARIELDGPKSEAELRELVSQEMNVRANRLFQKMLDLIQIRYQELDRMTRHGTRALPETFFDSN